MKTNTTKEHVSNLLNGNSAFSKLVVETYVCFSKQWTWTNNDSKCQDALTSDNLTVEIKTVKLNPSLDTVRINDTLATILDRYCTSDLVALYHGDKSILNESLIEVMTSKEFKAWVYHRCYLDKASTKNGGEIKIRFGKNYRTNAMTEKMKKMGLI